MNEETRYVRVETFSESEGKTVGGYMCSLNMLLCLVIDIKPTEDENVFEKAMLDHKDNMLVLELLDFAGELSTISPPEIYTNDADNHICLYKEDEFSAVVDTIANINEILVDFSEDLVLGFRDFYLTTDEICYEDEYQIVITKETYEKHKEETDFIMLPS